MTDWDRRFIVLAHHIAQWSKDPSTKCGAVIVGAHNKVLGLGYNGFPRGVEDKQSRLNDSEEKYAAMVHADVNAILNAEGNTRGTQMYIWPMLPCNECAKLIIQAGISRVVAPSMPLRLVPRWGTRATFAAKMMVEAGVTVDLWEGADNDGIYQEELTADNLARHFDDTRREEAPRAESQAGHYPAYGMPRTDAERRKIEEDLK